ncbi:SusD/RagB family nutrient-binding outer membrane lipoprotein [Chitinophaga varians]|uniref:SusD/RagB family nutrient-binding outer membrane lipoprotein n=1 Tax=Chitinophaga varians TaxID=2202339 RepID=UPI00165FE61D|nr:SusD/RagB family nutrient-binding outer membrane lipoprotein [Chitinophaga varians]MBC9912239.1 SusD/RagB family nutrient-binding outer membrane lipoprotein [Chitinophaga varians]
MKNVNKWGLGVAVAGMMLSACTKNFEDLNTNPQVSQDVPPEMLITQSEKGIVDRDFDWFYDAYTYQMKWMQFGVAAPGASPTGLFSPTNTNDFYNAFYKNIGRNLVEMEAVVAKKPEAERGQYGNVLAIAKILKVYSAWRASDANGSIPYTNAFQSRSDANYTPTYDTQEKMFPIWDSELKAAVATLQSGLSGQASPGNAEIFYSGDINKWAKAGNVLRIKLAMRQLKRTPDKATAIITDAMAVKNGLFESNADEWKFISADQSFARAGNWAMDNNPLSASKNMLDYMYNNSDPRLGIFYEKNSYTKELVDSLVKGGVFPSMQYNERRYFGLPASPDRRNVKADTVIFNVKRYTMTFNGKEVTRTLDTISAVQRRLFDLDAENGNNNGARYTQPILSYAEQCFMLAELAVRGIISGTAATYYNNGVEASIKAYDDMGREAKIRDYAPLDAAAITKYMANDAVAFTGANDVLLEKINIQNFLNLFKSPWEAWGAWKRTGIPKEGGILAFEPMQVAGQTVVIPRRWALPQPTIANQVNWRNAITEMGQTGEYGNADNDFTGRVWWDKK